MGCEVQGSQSGGCCDNTEERWRKLDWRVTVMPETRSSRILTVKMELLTREWGPLKSTAWDSGRKELLCLWERDLTKIGCLGGEVSFSEVLSDVRKECKGSRLSSVWAGR